MTAIRHPRPAVLFAVGLLITGAFAVLGSAPAFSYTQIYGSGAALQNLLQNNILIPDSGLSGDVKFTATTSGGGYKEFGNQGTHAGTLEPGEDTGAPTGDLDAYVATDSGPSTTELASAQTASGASSPNEIAVPVAQTPLDLLLSLPSGIALNSSQSIDLDDLLAGQLYAGTVPAAGGYSENTWGAFLTDVGLSETSNVSPSVGEFYDSGSSGGSTAIQVEVRKNGAGTTVNLKQYLPLVDPTDWGSIPVDSNAYVEAGGPATEWPATAKILPATTGNSNDEAEVLAVDGTPGTVGYATAGDANTNPALSGTRGTFQSTPSTSTDPPKSGGTDSASHQILYALLQDNYTASGRAQPIYADPQANDTGTANVYTGSNIQVNSTGTGGVGSWVVPESPGVTAFNATGTWSGTRASDPDVYDDSGDSIAYYPLVAVAFDLSWANFETPTLESTAHYTSSAQATTRAFLEFATSTTGQGDIAGHDYYAPLPSDSGNSSLANIQAVAQAAASGV